VTTCTKVSAETEGKKIKAPQDQQVPGWTKDTPLETVQPNPLRGKKEHSHRESRGGEQKDPMVGQMKGSEKTGVESQKNKFHSRGNEKVTGLGGNTKCAVARQ